MLNRYIKILLLLIIPYWFTACEDDFPYEDPYTGEGIANINATVSFHPLEPALESRAAGDAVHNVTSLWMVFYKVDPQGNAKFDKKILVSSLDGYKIDQNGNSAEPGDAATGPNLGATGETTPHATFSLTDIDFGRYRIYAVANVPDLTDADCATMETLRNKSFTWQTDVAKNNAMFGYFTPALSQTSNGFEAPIVYINRKSVDLHAWIKRLVSKVTVSIDPTGLKESVRVYIKSISIRDIPRTCKLGVTNTPTDTLELIKYGEELKYYTAETASDEDRAKWGMIVSKGSGVKGAVNHTEKDKALYFFENMQGDKKGMGSDYNKEQQIPELGTPINYPSDGPDYKDRVLCGTYVEVVGYYESKNSEKVTSGPIRYRFMLGKDVTYNYNAERNYHYKLTLKLRGFANEADWHIAYKEYTPQLSGPKDYYISYLYGQSINYPLRFSTGHDTEADAKNYTVHADIIENNWIPCDSTGKIAPNPPFDKNDIYGFSWDKEAYEATGLAVSLKEPYFGFLSLTPNEADIIGDGVDYRNGVGLEWLKDYYIQHPGISQQEFNLSTYPSSFDATDKSLSFKVPMYTRNKEMVPSTDFTGNNPYNCYYRKAVVRFTLWDKNGKQVSFKNEKGDDVMYFDTNIFQVPRVDNPKAIYRKHDSAASFDVELKILNGAGATNYTPVISDGPWRAYIMASTEDFIVLSRTGQPDVKTKGKYITGSTDEPIQFTYKPSGTIDKDKTRCGIIRIEYNDYTCVHLIFVRQGYHKGVKLGNATWSCYNVFATSYLDTYKSSDPYAPSNLTTEEVPVMLTNSPLSIGSYLRRCQYNYSIPESASDTYGWLTPIGSKSVTNRYIDAKNKVQTKSNAWDSIQGFAWYSYNGSAQRYTRQWTDNWKALNNEESGVKFSVPTVEHFNSLKNNCKFGYGIAYADGATETADNYADSNGYIDPDNTGVESPNGVRSCVVYEESGGRNIIFPLSKIGQGRRQGPSGSGRLTYTGLTTLLPNKNDNGEWTNAAYRPNSYNIYRRPGAVYWIRKPVTKKVNGKEQPDYASWDINYFTIVFNPYDYGSLSGWTGKAATISSINECSDALPIKLIYANNDGI
ncbi:MAG: hypothetical protein K2O00_06395 [Muribaculaceae bacterium]|nr:hypothetical protein [Muribaculaceae bacterium]